MGDSNLLAVPHTQKGENMDSLIASTTDGVVEKRKPLRIKAMMPLYRFMEGVSVQSLISMLFDIFKKGDRIELIFTQGINVCLARNQMFRYCCEEPEGSLDYILTLDSDHIYSAQLMYNLINKIEKYDLPLLSASYYVRGAKYFSMLKKDPVSKKMYNIKEVKNQSGVQECDVIGFGFGVFKADVIRKVYNKHKTLFLMDGKTYTGEDTYFCQLMQKEGYKIHYDPESIVGHLATVVLQ